VPAPGGQISFVVNICPAKPQFTLTLTVLAADFISDFESYFCTSFPCNAPDAILLDKCDCPLNIITYKHNGASPLTTFYTTVRGTGEYLKESSFLLSIRIDLE